MKKEKWMQFNIFPFFEKTAYIIQAAKSDCTVYIMDSVKLWLYFLDVHQSAITHVSQSLRQYSYERN